MSRLAPLADGCFDVLVIGAGIYGATLACAASHAGLRVALIDRGDYGGGASANSLKILHGGLRYLQHLDVPRMRESVRARREGLRRLPYLAHPASFVVPTGGGLTKSRMAFRAAALINDGISFDRNRGLPPGQALPSTAVWSHEDVRARCPALGTSVRSAMNWADGFIENTERYTLAYVLSAREQGAVTRNHVRAVELLRSGDAVVGARVVDEDSRETCDVRAAVTVNAAGAWAPDLWPAPGPAAPDPAWTRAYNLVVRRLWFGPYGVGLQGRVKDGAARADKTRMFFFAPWHGTTMVGTVYRPHDPERDSCVLAPGEIEAFIEDINRIYPPAELTPDDVVFAHVGVLPAQRDWRGRSCAEPSGSSRILDFRATHAIDGYLAIQGVKYTTAGIKADQLTAFLLRRLGRAPVRRDVPSLYGAESPISPPGILTDAARMGWTMEEETAQWLSNQYGSRYREVIALARNAAALREILPGSAAPLAAAAHAMDREDARHLDDILFRRTDLGTSARLDAETVEDWCAKIAALRGWDTEVQARECARVREQYRRLGLAP